MDRFYLAEKVEDLGEMLTPTLHEAIQAIDRSY
jgi:hypothetical protein